MVSVSCCRGFSNRTESIFTVGIPSSSLLPFFSTVLVSSTNLFSIVAFLMRPFLNLLLKKLGQRKSRGGSINLSRGGHFQRMEPGCIHVHGVFRSNLNGSTLQSLRNGSIHRRLDHRYDFPVRTGSSARLRYQKVGRLCHL